MKKLLLLIQLTGAVILYPAMSYADDDDWAVVVMGIMVIMGITTNTIILNHK